jgi:hypothetical protein
VVGRICAAFAALYIYINFTIQKINPELFFLKFEENEFYIKYSPAAKKIKT